MQKTSMLGAQYPDSPSNITTAAILNNRREETKISPEAIKSMGVDDLVSLNAEVFSISLVLLAFINGEISPVDLPRGESLDAVAALKLISEGKTISDEEFLSVFQKAVMVWPEILETDYKYTEKAVAQARKNTKEQGDNKDLSTITVSMVKDHVIDTMEASELMTRMIHYAFGISNRAEEAFGEDLD